MRVWGECEDVWVWVCVVDIWCVYRFLLRPAAEVQSRLHQQQDEVQHKITSLETCQHLQQQCVEYPPLAGAVDYQLCPGDQTLLACSHAGDVWLLHSSNSSVTRLTSTAGEGDWSESHHLTLHLLQISDRPDRLLQGKRHSSYK